MSLFLHWVLASQTNDKDSPIIVLYRQIRLASILSNSGNAAEILLSATWAIRERLDFHLLSAILEAYVLKISTAETGVGCAFYVMVKHLGVCFSLS